MLVKDFTRRLGLTLNLIVCDTYSCEGFTCRLGERLPLKPAVRKIQVPLVSKLADATAARDGAHRVHDALWLCESEWIPRGS